MPDVTDAHLALALKLLGEHRTKIARGTWRLAKRVDARVALQTDESAEGSIANILRALEAFLRTGDAAPLEDTVRATIQLRSLVGFGMAHFIAVGLAYLPVIRRVFHHYAPDPARAMDAFDVVESAVLPLVVRTLQEAQAAGAANEPDDETARHTPLLRDTHSGLSPFTSVSLEDITAEG